MTDKIQYTPELSDLQRKNLDLLATHLENLPENYQHFNMDVYLSYVESFPKQKEYLAAKLSEPPCGTVACALGHGPAAGIPMTDGFGLVTDLNNEIGIWPAWGAYTNLFCPEESHTDIFLFSGGWTDEDGTHRGAAARIRYVLAGRAIPLYPVSEGVKPHFWDFEPELYASFLITGDDHIKPQVISTPES